MVEITDLEEINNIYPLLPRVTMPIPNKQNSHRGNLYASLDCILESLKNEIQASHLHLRWSYEQENGIIFCVCYMTQEKTGLEWSSRYPVPLEPDPIKMGAINTYAKRQSLRNLLGWSNDPQEDPDDDDSPYGRPRGFRSNH